MYLFGDFTHVLYPHVVYISRITLKYVHVLSPFFGPSIAMGLPWSAACLTGAIRRVLWYNREGYFLGGNDCCFFSVLGIFLDFCFPASLLFCFLVFCCSSVLPFPASLLRRCSASLLDCFFTVLLLFCFLHFCFSSLNKPQDAQYKCTLNQP